MHPSVNLAPKERTKEAQGNALGTARNTQALKGRPKFPNRVWERGKLFLNSWTPLIIPLLGIPVTFNVPALWEKTLDVRQPDYDADRMSNSNEIAEIESCRRYLTFEGKGRDSSVSGHCPKCGKLIGPIFVNSGKAAEGIVLMKLHHCLKSHD
jgi:hypothetical protein